MTGFDLQEPEDLDTFWKETVDEARTAPLDYRRSLTNDYSLHGFLVETMSFRGMGGFELHGWLAYPEGARRLPAFLYIPPYGRESALPNQYGTRQGYCSLSLNFHGYSAFHQENYVPERGYLALGVDSPRTWIIRTMFQNAYLALRVLQAQNEADEDRIGSMGLSQGGGMSIWLGAQCPIVRAVCADLPFMGGAQFAMARNAYRYPAKELFDYAEDQFLGREKVLYTLGYFDTAFLARRCKVPTQVTLGLKDPSVRPDAARHVYENLPGEKRLIEYDGGHDYVTDMVSNNREWLDRYLREGRKQGNF